MKLIIAFFLLSVFALSTAFTPVFSDASPPPQINGNWLIDIRTLCAVGGVVLYGTWYIGRWMKGIDARLGSVEKDATDRGFSLVEIHRKLNSISCAECEHNFKQKHG